MTYVKVCILGTASNLPAMREEGAMDHHDAVARHISVVEALVSFDGDRLFEELAAIIRDDHIIVSEDSVAALAEAVRVVRAARIVA